MAKNVNFGVFYGLFPRGLQRTLKFKAGIESSYEECADMIENLKTGYPGLSVWQEEVKDQASRRMYTETWLGRRRYLPNINSDDWGQKCPKLGTEECTCRAPAALCYQPVSTEFLEELAGKLPITNKPLEDMKTASRFVEDYLYSQDVAVATAVISYTLKSHFKISAQDVRALISLYKKKNREYQSGLKTRQHKVADDLPLWYVPTERGLKFMPGVLAGAMKDTEKVFYAAQQHYRYEDGVYSPIPEMEAQRMVQAKMLPEEAKMAQITDAEKQWRLQIQKEIRELNANPFMINVNNGIYNVLEGKAF